MVWKEVEGQLIPNKHSPTERETPFRLAKSQLSLRCPSGDLVNSSGYLGGTMAETSLILQSKLLQGANHRIAQDLGESSRISNVDISFDENEF